MFLRVFLKLFHIPHFIFYFFFLFDNSDFWLIILEKFFQSSKYVNIFILIEWWRLFTIFRVRVEMYILAEYKL